MQHHPLPGAASSGQLALFDQWSAGWPGGVAATWWGSQNPRRQGVIATRRGVLWMQVAELLNHDRVRLVDALSLALSELAGLYAANAGTSHKVLTEVARFVRYAEACGVEFVDELEHEHVNGYVWAATRHRGRVTDVKPRTAANRQAFIRRFIAVLASLGLWGGEDIVGPAIERGASESSRPLTDEEMRLVEVHAHAELFASRRPLLVAFAQAGADASEIAIITAADVDMANGFVTLGRDERRTNPLTEWGHRAVAEVLRGGRLEADSPLCVGADRPAHRAAHSITVGLRDVLVDAAIAGRPRVTARSIALTSARRILAEKGLIAAASFLGANSLDATAAALDYDWKSI
jgi:hypothetical protein